MYKTADWLRRRKAQWDGQSYAALWLQGSSLADHYSVSAAHWKVTLACGTFGSQRYACDAAQHTGQWSSANTSVQLGSQSSGRELSSAAKMRIGRATGLLICRPKAPMDYSEGISSSSTSWM